MKIFRPTLFAFALFAMTLSTSTADAQGQLAGGDSMLNLLRNERVLKELKINDDQKKEITQLNENFQSDLREMFAEIRNSDPGDRLEMMEDLRADMKTLADEADLSMVKLLDEKQEVRAKELKVQRQLLNGVARALAGALGKQLGVEDAEVEAVTVKTKEVKEWEAAQIAKIRAEAREKILSAMPEKSREKLKEMAGETFDFGEVPRASGAVSGVRRGGAAGGNRRGGGARGQRPRSDF